MNDNIYEKKWYIFLKKKYKINDDDMQEYIDSFEYINQGRDVDSQILADFLNDELDHQDFWTVHECEKIINKINYDIDHKVKRYLNLRTYLYYIIPICQEYIINKVGIDDFFKSIDVDHDGWITCDQLVAGLYHVNKKYTDKDIDKLNVEIKNLCKKEDNDKDGYLSYDEFKNFMIKRSIPISKN